MKLSIASGVALLAALAACSGGDSTGPSQTVAHLSVSPNPVTLAVGDSAQLAVTATSSSGGSLSATVGFTSLNPSIATVSGTGVVRGVAAGSTQVVASAGAVADTVTVTVTAAGGGGGLTTFNVNANQGCTVPQYASFRTAAVGQHVILMEDTRNPANGFTPTEYQGIASRFDSLVWPTDTGIFGTPSDIDNNGKVIVLFTRAVNELTPSGVNYIVGGFFYSRDLFPRTAQPGFQACAGSNYAELFYMLAPDSLGTINGNKRTKSFVSSTTIGTLAHEFQHLINASRRLYVNNANSFEAPWLDEGLAHSAEELNFYADAGIGSRQNVSQNTLFSSQTILDAFNEFGISNFGRFAEYLARPDTASPYSSSTELPSRGAIWSLLRYSADRTGSGDQAFYHALVNSRDSGLVNLEAVVGPSLADYVRDWTVANYTDDAVAGVEPRFTHPSWNFRDVFSNRAFGGYPLKVDTLRAGTAASNTIKAGTAAYYRFGVGAGSTADVRVSSTGSTIGGACTPVNLTVGQVYQASATATPALCVPAAGEYTLVVTYDALTPDVSTPVSVVGTSITGVSGPPSPNLIPAAAHPSLFPGRAPAHDNDGGWEMRLRLRERRELTPMLLNRAPSRSVSFQAAPTAVVLSLVRTK